MRQSVGGVVIERKINRQPLWINAPDRRQQRVANALNVGGKGLSPTRKTVLERAKRMMQKMAKEKRSSK